MENPINMDELGVPLFSETPIYLQFRRLGKKTTSSGQGFIYRHHPKGLKNGPTFF